MFYAIVKSGTYAHSYSEEGFGGIEPKIRSRYATKCTTNGSTNRFHDGLYCLC